MKTLAFGALLNGIAYACFNLGESLFILVTGYVLMSLASIDDVLYDQI